jgi:dissimilatory sulfite reductase related protein
MSALQIADRELSLSKKGYLERFDDWDRAVALALAAEDGLTLNESHWKVIEYLRQYFATHEMPPNPRLVVQAVGDKISAHVPWTRKDLEALFPAGGCRQACRIAGLPDYYCHGC